jgi:hypothetical protein
VLAGHPVPASDKPHADIIRKGREVAYGHKLNLTTGQSGLILDLVIEAGNPADSERLLPMLERHRAFYDLPPRHATADGSYASRDNLRRAHACGVRDMAFYKKGGLGGAGVAREVVHGRRPVDVGRELLVPDPGRARVVNHEVPGERGVRLAATRARDGGLQRAANRRLRDLQRAEAFA